MTIRAFLPIATVAAIGATALAVSGPARGRALDDLLTRPRLTGDWGGVRTDLEDFGIHPFARYLNEVAGNPSGGKHQDITYTDQIDFGIDADLGKLIGLTGGKLRVAATDRNGTSLSEEDIGNLFAVQQDFGGNEMFRLGELSYAQSLFDDRLEFRVGRIFAANDFATSPLYCNLMNHAYCARPNTLLYDAPISSYPVATWGGRVKAMPTSDTYLQVGAYEDNPSQAFRDGTDFSTDDATGVFVVGEFAYLFDNASGTKGMPGHYKIGF